MGIFSGLFSAIGGFFGVIFSPVTLVFHYVFFLPVFNILMLIYQGVHSFGISIILLTLLIRGSLFPLTRRQIASSRKMQELTPKINALRAQYRGDNAGLMAAQQALYKEHGVSMYGGCLPLLVQMPFLYALYYSFYQVLSVKGDVLKGINNLIYPLLPHLTTAPNPSFLGLSLITPSFWLALLAGVLTFLQMRMSLPVSPAGATTANDPAAQTANTMKTMQYIMPFFTFFIGTRFPAGLALYWSISTAFSAVQQYFITGWGSLWVGVPGMERYVPKPAAAAAIAAPAPSRRNTTVESSPAAQPSGGFFARLGERYRELASQASAQAAADRASAEARRAGAAATMEPEADTTGEDAAEEGSSAAARRAASAARERRQRSSRSGVTLVPPPAGGDTNAAAPETRIAQEASGSGPVAEDLPEQRIARENTLATSRSGAVKNVNGVSAGRQGGKSANGKSSAQNGQSGGRGRQQSGSRNRNRGSR
ncbi:MAG TPA: YidC/Oxa1 family membrane protein insertase [Ktedonobacterales bacterium]